MDTNQPFSKSLPKSTGGVGQIKDIDFPPEGPGGSEDHNFGGDTDDENIADIDIDETAPPVEIDNLATIQSETDVVDAKTNSNKDSSLMQKQLISSQVMQKKIQNQNIEQIENLQIEEDFSNFQRIADLPWEQKVIEKQKFWDTKWLEYEVGEYIDGVDSVQKWCLAQIVQRDEYTVKIHFDGWSSKWDVVYKWNSYRIAPFRRYSAGYSGQQRTPLRQNMIFDVNELVQQTHRVLNLAKNKFNGLTAKQVTQFLRGSIFVYTDFLLSGQYHYSDDDADKINIYFKAVIKLICVWIKEVPALLQKVSPDIRKDSDIFLVDEDVAIFQAYPELLGLLHRFFLGCHRCLRYFIYYDRDVEKYSKVPITIQAENISFIKKKLAYDQEYDIDVYKERVYDKDRNFIFGQAINFLNFFAEQDGFELIIQLLKSGNLKPQNSQSKSSNDKDDTYELMSLDFLSQILTTFSNCGQLFQPQFSQKFVQTVQDIVNIRFANIKDKDIKEFQKDELPKFLKCYQQFLQISKSQQEVSQIVEQTQLMFSARFLNTSYLEKKLQGINDLRHIIERVTTRQLIDKQALKYVNSDQIRPQISFLQNQNGQKIYPTQYIDVKILKEWIIKEKIAENLFGEGSHTELFKRSVPIIKFLCKNNGITQEVIDLIWKSQQGKHEETVRVIYNTIIELVIDLPIVLLNYLFTKILEVPQNQYNEMYLQFLKDFTLQALDCKERAEYRNKVANQDNKQEQINQEELDKELKVFNDLNQALQNPEKAAFIQNEDLLGLPIFWNLIQDNFESNFELQNSEILDISLKAIHEILNKQSASKLRIYYLLKALNNLKNGETLYPIISILILIMQNFDNQIILQRENQKYKNLINSSKSIIQIEKQLGLINIIITDILKYNNEVKNHLKSQSLKNKVPSDKIENMIIYGRSSHQSTLEKLFEILEYVVLTSDWAVTISNQNIELLWKTFVLHPNFQIEQTLFLQFVNKKRFKKIFKENEVYMSSRQKQEVNIFTSKEQHHLFTQILCNSTFVDYQKITLGEAKCFHTYFQLINKEEENLNIFQNKIELLNYKKLQGLESLWRITFDSENEKATEQSGELLIDLHLRVSNNYSQDAKKNIIIQFIEKCMQQLLDISQMKQLLSQIDQKIITQEQAAQKDVIDKKILKVVQMLSEFLNRYEGKKQIKAQMKQIPFQFQNIQPYNIVVIHNQGQGIPPVDGKIQVSQFETIGAVRERCANLFGLEINEFILKFKNGIVDPDEDDDKYVKDHGISAQILLINNAAYNKLNHPKYIISQNQEYFDLLFSLLTNSGAILIEPVWELLQKLPVNKKLHEDIKSLEGAQQNWNNLLDSASTHKLLYSLKIIQALDDKSFNDSKALNIQNQDTSSLILWKQKFIELGGFNHLLKIYSGVQVQKIDSKLTLMWIETMLNVLIDFLKINSNLQDIILQNQKDIIFKSLQHIYQIGLFTLSIETQRGEPFEDIQAKRQQIKLAKQKIRSQQSLNQGKKGQQTNDDANSDGEDDEINKKVNNVIREFSSIKTIVESIFNFMSKYIFMQHKQALQYFHQYEDLQNLIKVLMIQSENWALRQESGRQLKQIIVGCRDDPSLQKTIITSIKIMLFEILPLTQQHERRCNQFFDLVRKILEELSSNDLQPLQDEISKIIKKIAVDIQNRETKEQNTKTEDRILVGQMNILKALLQKYPKFKKSIGNQLVTHLLDDCLFQVSHQTNAGIAIKPKCKSFQSRNTALQLLSTLSRDCIENLQVLLDYLKNFDQQQSWRSNKQSDWQITHLDDEKSTTGYVGLKNLGCICYMISLFQQLFMVPGFCNDILQCDDPNFNNSETDENMFYQFQTIFAGLLKSEKQYVNPKGFCHAFKDWEGQPTNVLEQMDVEEFLQMFFDRLETAIKGTKQEKTIQYHFGGKFASEMICKGCPHYYERSEPFLSIGIQVKNKRSIQEGLNAFIQGDMLEGDNAYLCAKCDKKVDTLKRTCVKELPRYLIVTLKRFEFDFDRMMRVKVNDFCEFPMELDMLPYTQEGLQRKEKAAKSKQEANENGGDFIEEELIHPKDYYEFKLKGIVVHSGTADSGHYYSFIKDNKLENGEKWYEFNDNIVRDFDLADLANECFGGEETFQGIGQGNFKSQKWGNAYLVIYERKNQNQMKNLEDENQQNENSEINQKEISQEQEQNKISVLDPQHPIQQKISLENQKYWQNKFLFGQEYFDFVSEICHYWDTSNIIPLISPNKNNDYQITCQKIRVKQDHTLKQDIVQPLDEIYDLRSQYDASIIRESAHNVFKFASRFYITILQRAQNKTLVPKFVDAIKAYLNYDSKNGKWLIQQLSNWDIIEELFLQLSGVEMPKIVVGIVYCAMISIYDEEKNHLNSHWNQVDQNDQQQGIKEDGILGNFILLLISNLYKIQNFNLNIPHYFQILSRFASLGSEAREFLLRAKIVGRCMDYFFDKASPYRDDFANMSDLGKIFVNEQPEIGLPTQIDVKMTTFFQLIQEQRRSKFISQAIRKYKYMFELISQCVCHLNVGGNYQAPFQIDQGISKLETFIDPKESDIFVPEAGFLMKAIQECKRSRSMWSIARAHVHYASLEKDQIQELFKTVYIGLKEFDYDGIRPFLCLFEVLISTDHPNIVFQRNEQLVKFLDVIKNNLIFYKWMEAVIEFLLKIICKYSHVKEWFYKQQNEWKFLIDWVNQNQRAPHPAQMQQTIQLYKFNQTQIQQMQYGDVNEALKNTISARYRFLRFQQLLQQNLPDLSQENELDKYDLQDFKFQIGDLVVIYDRKREDISRWRVVKVLDEMINITCIDQDNLNKNKLCWQKCDTDKLKLESHYRTNQRTRLRAEIREQFIAQRQEAIRLSQRQNQINVEQDASQEPKNSQQQKQKQISAGGDTEGASSHEANSEAYGSSEEDNQDLYANN